MSGYRGYVGSRPLFGGGRTPQHVQNIVLRDYARRKKLHYLLSAVEYAMPDCFQILESILTELSGVDGILCYSLFMLPDEEAKRIVLYDKILAAKKSIHFAVEDLTILNANDISRIEDIWLTQKLIAFQRNPQLYDLN